MMGIKNHIRSLIRRTGFDINRYPLPTLDTNRNKLLLYHNIDVVLDVGANIGQYGESLRSTGYKGKIISFEPMSTEFNILQNKISRDPLWECHKIALGCEEGIMDINISRNSISSSFLPMLYRHAAAAPKSVFIGKESVEVKRLDTIAPKILPPHSNLMLKIDTQGYELKVLMGAENTIPLIKMIEVELSFVPLYEGQPLITDVINYLDKKGFSLVCIHNGFIYKTGHAFQADGIFVRKELCPFHD